MVIIICIYIYIYIYISDNVAGHVGLYVGYCHFIEMHIRNDCIMQSSTPPFAFVSRCDQDVCKTVAWAPNKTLLTLQFQEICRRNGQNVSESCQNCQNMILCQRNFQKTCGEVCQSMSKSNNMHIQYVQYQNLSEDFGQYSTNSSDVSNTSQYVLLNMIWHLCACFIFPAGWQPR